MILEAYKCRLYPNEEQKVFLERHFGASRWIYNWGLQKRIEYYQSEKKTLSIFALANQITHLKKQEDLSWLAEIESQSLRVSLFNLDKAYSRFFREKKGFPKFKSKKTSKKSFSLTQSVKIDFETEKIKIPLLKTRIKIKINRIFNGKIKTVTISKTSTNKYFASILVEESVEIPLKPMIAIEKAVGIDLGLKSFITTSNGQKFDNPKFLTKSERKLKKEHRRFSKKKKGGLNKEKQRIILARAYEKVANQRNDFLHKTSKQLIDDNQVDTYCFETLQVQNMMKNHNLAKAISDVGWSEFVRQMKYKADWYGKNILQIGTYEPSSKICNSCGLINQTLTLADREWTCECGAVLDRDINAAKNIRDIAFAKQNLIGNKK